MIEVALGSIFATNVQAISLVRGVIGDIKGIFGGKAGVIEKKVQDSVDGVKLNLYAKLKELYPTAKSVIGVDIRIIEFDNYIVATLSGTPIGLKSGGSKNTTRKNRI